MLVTETKNLILFDIKFLLTVINAKNKMNIQKIPNVETVDIIVIKYNITFLGLNLFSNNSKYKAIFKNIANAPGSQKIPKLRIVKLLEDITAKIAL